VVSSYVVKPDITLTEMKAVMEAVGVFRREMPRFESIGGITFKDAVDDLRLSCSRVLAELVEHGA
jgi:hypothetical protein